MRITFLGAAAILGVVVLVVLLVVLTERGSHPNLANKSQAKT